MKFFLSMILLSWLSSALAAPKVIYGNDDRYEPATYPLNLFQTLGNSTAAMMDPSELTPMGDDKFEVTGRSLRDWGLCETERFLNQPTSSSCSAFLVGDDILVTAGHCASEDTCDGQLVVFGYKIPGAAMSAPVTIAKSDIYKCKKIIEHKFEGGNGGDYSVIRLDRKVIGRTPLKYRRSGSIPVGMDLVVIGHPAGLPMKIADGARIKSIYNLYFVANLDTYGGNSGSAVFDKKTGLVEGILVRGETDYVLKPENNCRVSNVLSDSSVKAEHVMRITNLNSLK